MSRIRPFATGTQYFDWQCNNCDKCKKAYNSTKMRYDCRIQEAIGLAGVGDGMVSQETAKWMGFLDNKGKYNWTCPEFEEDKDA